MKPTDQLEEFVWPPPPLKFAVSYLKFKLEQKYYFRYKTAKFNSGIRKTQTIQIYMNTINK